MMIEHADYPNQVSQCKLAESKLKSLGKAVNCCNNGGDKFYNRDHPTACDVGGNVVDAFTYEKYSYKWIQQLSKDEIKKEISFNRQLVGFMSTQVYWTPLFSGELPVFVNHFEVIHGYDDTGVLCTLYVYDPFTNRDFKILYSDYVIQTLATYYHLTEQ